MHRSKAAFIILLMLGFVIALQACSIEESEYMFNGKVYKESVLEEHLSDLIELENPELDIEVNISEEVDD
jgi:hypothetical protein